MVDISSELLGYSLDMPLMIAPMSGGWALGQKLNEALAALAERHKIGFAVGSMRPALRSRSRLVDYDVKRLAPTIPVLGNLGVWQVRDEATATAYHDLCVELGFDGLMVHINPAHELAQPEGERDLDGVADAIRRLASRSSLPVIVKEVGYGFTQVDLEELSALPIQGIDIAGAGGTNWALVEAARTTYGSPEYLEARVLAEGGRSTLSTLIDAAPLFWDRVLIGGGGIRDASDIAKILGLGAHLASIAAPILGLVCSERSDGSLMVDGARADEWLRGLGSDLRRILASAGVENVEEMRDGARVVVHA